MISIFVLWDNIWIFYFIDISHYVINFIFVIIYKCRKCVQIVDYIITFRSQFLHNLLSRSLICTSSWKNGPKYNSFLFLFFKWDISGLFCRLFLSFKTNITFFQQNTYVKFLISVWCRDLNPQPLVSESPPITTTPRLPPVTKNNSFYPNWKSKRFTVEASEVSNSDHLRWHWLPKHQ